MNHITITASAIPKAAIWVLLALAFSCRVPDSGPPIGHLMPIIVAKDLAGQTRIISSLNAPCVLFFFTPTCQPCNQLLDYLASLLVQPDTRPLRLFLVVTREKQEALTHKLLHGFPVLVVDQQVCRNTFRVSRTPVLLSYQTQGRLTRKHLGWKATNIQRNLIEDLIQEARKPSSPNPRLLDNEPVQLTRTYTRR